MQRSGVRSPRRPPTFLCLSRERAPGFVAYCTTVMRADVIFSELMGEEVQPRKKFIQSHYDKVRNLDV